MGQQQQGKVGSEVALMIFAAVSATVVLVIVVIVGIEVINTRLSGGQAAGANTAIPYNIAARPLAPTKTLDQTFPQKLGSFTRGPISGGFVGFSMNYANGRDVIVLKGSQLVSLLAAQASVQRITDLNGRANQGQGSDSVTFRYSYYLNVTDTNVRFVWSHDRWLYDITTDAKSVLDNFMAVFPY